MRLGDWIRIAGLAAVLFCLWLGWAHLSPAIAKYFLNKDDQFGVWGDSFGGFNALISALGFAAVLTTLVIQGRALRDQQRDQHRQRFESSFFELLALLRELRDEVKYSFSAAYQEAHPPTENRPAKVPSQTGKGSIAITSAIVEVRYWLLEDEGKPAKVTEAEIVKVYERFVHKRYEAALGAYFRIFYTILRRIRDDRILTDVEKEEYGNLLRSQITSHELVLAAVNSLSPVAKDFRHLLAHFHFFKYMPPGRFKNILQSIHGKRAFSPRPDQLQ